MKKKPVSSLEASRVYAKIIREIMADIRKEKAVETRRKRAMQRRKKFHIV